MKVTHLIFKYLFLFTLLLGIVGCEDETFNQKQSEDFDNYKGSKLKRVNVKDLNFLDNYITSKIRGSKTKDNDQKSVLETPFGLINLEDVMEIENLEGDINYTFRIDQGLSVHKSFDNLIVHKLPNGEIESYVLRYIMSDEFAKDYYEGNKDIKDFKGSIQKFSLDGYEIFKSRTNKGICEGDSDGDSPLSGPCEIVEAIGDGNSGTGDEDIPNPLGDTSDGNSGSSGGTSGSGTTGNTNTTGGDTGSDGGVNLTCRETNITICCENGICDFHLPRTASNLPNGKCSGTIIISIFECIPDEKSMSSKSSGCSDGGGTVGVDLFSSGLSIEQLDFLEVNCPEAAVINSFYTNYSGFDRKAILFELIDLLMARPDLNTDLNLAANISNALIQNSLNGNQAIKILNFIKSKNRSESSISAALATTKVISDNLLYGPYDQNYYQSFNHFVEFDTTDPYFGIRFSAECAILKATNPNLSDLEVYLQAMWNLTKEPVHLVLDVAGLIPVVGEAADLINGAIYLLEGDNLNAGLSFAGAIPFAGWAATGSKLVVKVVTDVAGEKALKVVAHGAAEVSAMANKLARFTTRIDNAINSIKNGARYVLEGTGAYKQVNGHHALSKKAFEGVDTYSYREAFSVSNSKLSDFDVAHATITGKQNSLYSAWKRANPNASMSIEDMANIEVQAMVQSGIPSDVARGWVIKALEDLKTQGVYEIKNIPWNGVNPI